MAETELEMAERYVAMGERHILRQREVISEMKERGESTYAACRLLQNFEDMQVQHIANRDRLLR
ncbi:MAG TPA: hypothetical protein VIU14_02775 [Mesorhizobium sp.]|jgi:hypothetical protein